ncbi:GTP-binding protein [Oceanobacter mangrovi]|uniref:GTP-binding protein n=1 Tax=Oceanobacter mangrovi TaxID=2862510 RepID=UPI001C8D7913|nr:ATP/GTP-binding protein [Oceanobacter mangrovi]
MHHKIIFTGPVGAGKSTAIAAISDKPVVTTEARASDEVSLRKQTTTVAMDYGVLQLADGQSVHLYGTPGQQRFDYMWEILSRGGLALVILLDNSREDPVADMVFYLDKFRALLQRRPVCIGVTRMDLARSPRLHSYQQKLAEMGIKAPVFEVDARKPNDVKTLVRSILHILAIGS